MHRLACQNGRPHLTLGMHGRRKGYADMWAQVGVARAGGA
jgi:hypothetical protein